MPMDPALPETTLPTLLPSEAQLLKIVSTGSAGVFAGFTESRIGRVAPQITTSSVENQNTYLPAYLGRYIIIVRNFDTNVSA
jgi:hypothetical protein